MDLAPSVRQDLGDVSTTLAGLHADRFPDASLVGVAASLFPKLPRWDGSEQTRRYYLTVSPGTVALAVRDVARAERCNNDDLGPVSWSRNSLGKIVARPSPGSDAQPSLLAATGMAGFLNVTDPGPGHRTPSREVAFWSRRSRARMVQRFAELDYRPLLGRGHPAMVTLTYPGDWQTVAPNGRAVKRHLRVLVWRWRRRWGTDLAALWKLEFQRRGAPHFHLFVVPPVDAVVGPGGRLFPASEFTDWLSQTWADIVAHPDPEHRRRHVLAGTGVDYAEASRYADPRRLAVYFSGHSLKAHDGKEYQHIVPELWRGPGDGPGRFWGYMGIPRVTATVEVTQSQFVALRQTLRGLSGSRRRPGRARRVDRVDTRTGVVRSRMVTRSARGFSSGRLAGGWLVANNGPGLMSTLARHPAMAC